MQMHLFPAFRNSDLYSTFLISVLTSGNVTLDDVLLNDTTFMVLMEFVEREGASLLLQFWLSLVNLRQQLTLPDVTEQQLRDDALGLDKRFIQATGAQSLPLDAHTRCEAAVLLGQPGAHQHAAWFERIEHLVHTALNKHYFPAFLHSEMFYKFLNGAHKMNP